MKPSFIFATTNSHKVEEALAIAGSQLHILSLQEAGLGDVILEETADTLQGNAIQKALALYAIRETDCFAEDTGLEVDALHGAPGVLTARYAGDDCDASKNMAKLLDALSTNTMRNARFRTVIALITRKALFCFEGTVEGNIAEIMDGTGGFGYDPVFIPDGYNASFAQLPPEVKNALSHRSQALHKMMTFVRKGSYT